MGKIKKTDKKTFDKISKIGIFAGSLLITATAVYFYSPIIKTHAGAPDTSMDSAELDINLRVKPAISISTDVNELDLSEEGNSFFVGTVNANVSTNSQYGYSLTLEDNDDNTNLTHTDANIQDTLQSDFNGATTSSSMPDNKWGYSLDSTNFYKIPVYGLPVIISRSDNPTSTNSGYVTTAVDFGAKVSMSLTSGTYVDVVRFTAYVNGQDGNPVDFFGISKMQEMTPLVCNSATTPNANATAIDWDGSHKNDKTYVPRTVLEDVRDGNQYLVTKLADGNCWMSQNLALELSNETPLNNRTTDLNTKATWLPDLSTTSGAGPDVDWGISSTDSTQEASASVARSFRPQGNNVAYIRGGKNGANTPTAEGREYLWEKNGYLYNWKAATAGSGTFEITEGSVDDSICPRGWRLPFGNPISTKSYSNLMRTYGANKNTINLDPLNFVWASSFSGTGYNYYTGGSGTYTTATAKNSYSESTLGMNKNSVFYDDYESTYKYAGLPIRCVNR